MIERIHKVPGPEHPITLGPAGGQVQVVWQGTVIADSVRALAMQESRYPVVYYFPRDDVDMSAFVRSDALSWCPYKGEASYYELPGAGKAVWSYETPFDAVKEIEGHLAFYPDKVDRIGPPAR